ncbi:hypothetical protein MMOR_22730 [Mycolicibacterium moriokaense]|jgi:hypothetical protein|uniref:Uncharacterized protein n=1 Tax=Mycolicibacterium moriokaense TaxID=39691 RepID=A0AAD1M5D8_9MYCO|nr:hypothetical protein MMOR_22730 [Mycolicibacterium moriokaense]
MAVEHASAERKGLYGALYTATKTSNSIVAYLVAVSVISAASAWFLPAGKTLS